MMLKDRHLPWLFVVFFAVVLSANGIMVFFAVNSWTGLETEGHYRKGLAYNRALEDVERQTHLGWTMAIDFAEIDPVHGRLDVELTKPDGPFLHSPQLSARFIRPTHAGYDFTMPLRRDGNRYVAEVKLPLPGQWDIEVTAEHPEGRFRRRERVVVR